MPYAAPTANGFVDRFPRFQAVGTTEINRALTEAARRVDETWTEDDFQEARMLYAAHVLTLDGHGEGAESEIAKAGAMGFRSFRSGSLSLDRSDAGGGMLGQTSYGLRFLELMRRNCGGPVVANGVS